MKHPLNDEVQQHRERLRLRIDEAAKSVAEALQAAVDVFIAASHRKADEGMSIGKAEASPITGIMTPQQAADYLGVGVQTLGVWRCTRRYPLPFVKVGSKVSYRKSDLDKFIERRTHGGDDES